ncbi:disulfide bond formation protein DsbB [Vibrio sp. SCSIO 43136]|uniref:disulfide bond formation protein DsbB n=1 Tax=Vibrio sp. SCSIO 43136 TaxID=2819101 RepID=UPI002075C5B1|nr:disulfide bond formation protein DsbB [Vibrio sp. SCSIO 43136]USD64430.1 disulfide bond formation protein DsbB [Vibrio sp. SCSIO 43136]
MHFLYPLKQFSTSRWSWFALFLAIAALELTALYFQHVMMLAPCVMCIYERVAMAGVGIAALVGLAKPSNPILRWAGFAGWGFSAYRGLMLSLEHVDYQFNPSPFKTCDIFVSFPDWAPLHKWMPNVFNAYGDCSKVVWEFIGLSMPQWLVVIFAGMLVALVPFVLAQFSKPAK